MNEIQQKTFEGQFELKGADDGRIEGYGAVFGNRDTGGDVIAPGAFAESLKAGRMPKMLYQHDPSTVIGVWDRVEEDAHGLRVAGRLILDTDAGRNVRALLREKAIDGLSIGYRTVQADRRADGARRILKAELWEVSVVAFPMNEAAKVTGVKELKSALDVERILRGAGLSRRAAEKIAQGGWPALRGDTLTDDETKGVADRLRAVAAELRGEQK